MNETPEPIIRQLRSLMPIRPLEEHEARGIAERQATLFLELLGQHQPAVDVGLVAELPRVEVKVEPKLGATGILGFSHWSRGRWLIVVNREDSATRRRFTLGHEFKHVLDHPYLKVIYSKLGSNDAHREDLTEKICNYFAACLLMPRTWIKREWANGVQDQATLAARFDVSEAAMAIRLREIGLLEPRRRHLNMRGLDHPVRSYFRSVPAMRPEVCL